MRKILLPITIALSAVVMFSCSDSHKAQQKIKHFMGENMQENIEITDMYFSGLDSTKRLNDSIIKLLREKAQSIPLYKSGIKFTQPYSNSLKFMSVTYKTTHDTLQHQQTYYFDNQLQGIVVIKNY